MLLMQSQLSFSAWYYEYISQASSKNTTNADLLQELPQLVQ